MKRDPIGSVECIICDLPYGTKACKCDSISPFEPLREQYKRVIKKNGAIVLFGSEPFSSHLRMSNMGMYKYDWYWKKHRPSGFVNAKLKPLKDIETISVFSDGTTANKSSNNMIYNPQGLIEVNAEWKRPSKYKGHYGVNPTRNSHVLNRIIEFGNYPRQILNFPNSNKDLIHPTQKPVAIIEYLIRTYSNEGDTILDNCMGSGTTAIACINTNRRYIGFEMDRGYYDLAQQRIANHMPLFTQ